MVKYPNGRPGDPFLVDASKLSRAGSKARLTLIDADGNRYAKGWYIVRANLDTGVCWRLDVRNGLLQHSNGVPHMVKMILKPPLSLLPGIPGDFDDAE